MGGGLMQLVAYGAQDIYLTGNPQITFFKVVYRKHTNFSMESIQQTFSGSGGQNPVCTISRNGDLVHKMYLVSTETTDDRYTPRQITTVELEIGGQSIDRQSGQWMDTWNELSTPESKAIGLKAMTGQIGADGTGVDQVHIPLLFWFCRNPGLALPLIALQYHEVNVKFTLASSGNAAGFELYCDYIYLDTDERRRFAQVSHEYLIEQVQEQSSSTGSNKLNFNHPVKELIWSTHAKADSVGLKLNGHDRFSTRKDEYFYLQQPFDYHTAVPKQNLPNAARIPSFKEATLGAIVPVANVADGRVYSYYQAVAVDAASQGKRKCYYSSVASNESGHGVPLNTLALGDGSNPAPLVDLFNDTCPVGTTLAILALTKGVNNIEDDLTGTPSAVAGDIWFARVTGAATVHLNSPHGLNIPISAPLDSTGKTLTEIKDATPGYGNGGFVCIFKVSNTPENTARTSKDNKPIGVYSFALKPEEHQPSGTCNFSRIDNAELTLGGSPGSGVIYAVNYNVLRIMSGMGGLAYSN